MTDLISNVQEVYKKWESRSVPNCGRSSNFSVYNHYNGRRQNYENDNAYYASNPRSRNPRNCKRTPHYTIRRYDGLAEFKMSPSVVSLNKTRPFVGIPCAKCVPHSRAGIEDSTLYLLGVHNVLRIPYFTLETFNICCFWNIFKFRTPLFSCDNSADLLESKRVKETCQEIISKETREDISDEAVINELNQKGKDILKSLKASVSSFYVQITCFCLHYVLKKLFNGIFVHKGQLEILKVLNQDGIPFVFLPLHRSYFDYILVPYILHRNSVKTPYTTVTDELYIPVLSSIFRYLGAVFVKNDVFTRKCNDNILYSAILQSYIIRCLEEGHNIEFFLEDYRSVSGKPDMPNTHLLLPLVNSILEGSIEDAYIVPVSTAYERVGESFIAEKLGGYSKEKSSIFSKLYSFWKIMHLKYGNVRVNFNQPFSLKEFLKTCSSKSHLKHIGISDSPSCDSSSKEIDTLSNNIDILVNDLAIHVMHDATTCTSLMCTHLLAFLLVTQYRKGGTQQQLQNSMDWLRGEIHQKKCDVGFTGESLPVIKRAVELLGKDLISIEIVEMEWTSSDLENNNVKVKIYTPLVKLPYVLELQYYANAVVPLFLQESILVNALYALVDVDICHFHHCDSRFYISRERLVQTAIKLSNFLKYEFITVPPCQDIVSSFNDVVDKLIDKECLSTVGVSDHYMKSNRRSYALSFEASDDEQCSDETEEQQLKIDLREESVSHLEFLRNILSPYIESYWLASCSLLRLIDEVKEENVFIQEMQMTAQDKLYKGLLAYEESFSANTFKNCLKMFSDRHIIDYDYEDSIKIIYLSEPFNSFESVNDVIADIEDFRK